MASAEKNLSDYQADRIADAANMTFAIVVSDYNAEIGEALLNACLKTLLDNGASNDSIIVYHVPGAFELVAGAAWVARKLSPDAVITLGCVIKGETPHDHYINQAVSNAIAGMNAELDLPVIFGLLTVNNKEQAFERAGGSHGNKGVECAVAAIQMLALKKEINKGIVPL